MDTIKIQHPDWPLTKGERNRIIIALETQVKIYTEAANKATKELFAVMFRKEVLQTQKLIRKMEGKT